MFFNFAIDKNGIIEIVNNTNVYTINTYVLTVEVVQGLNLTTNELITRHYIYCDSDFLEVIKQDNYLLTYCKILIDEYIKCNDSLLDDLKKTHFFTFS